MIKKRTLAAAAGAAALGIVAVAGPALAAPPYTVKVGSNTSGTFNLTAARVSGTPLVVKAGNLALNCTNVTGAGNVTAGTGKNPVANITSTSFTGCTVLGNNASITQIGTWNLTGTGNATTANETIAGYVGGVSAKVQTTPTASICNFNVTGTANGSFDEATQRLVINEVPASLTVGNLKLSNVSGCGGNLANGYTATFQATLGITSSAGAVALSS